MPEYWKGEFGTRTSDYLQPHRKTVRSHGGAAYGKGAVRRHGAHGQTENGEAGVRPGTFMTGSPVLSSPAGAGPVAAGAMKASI